MKKGIVAIGIILTTALVFMSFKKGNYSLENKTVQEVLLNLGGTKPIHYMEPDSSLIKMGKDLVYEGRTIGPNGKKSKPISIYFGCRNCHNLVKEDPDISNYSDPDARLEYTSKNNIPFVQGSTFWGIVNRESWYNDDYYKKYGEAVQSANKDLRKSIQLCAIECSQGRPLEKWEEDAVLAYYWSLQLKMSDLNLTSQEKEKIEVTIAKRNKSMEMIELIKSKYALKAPATFQPILEDKVKGYDEKGDPAIGKLVYENSCRNCHAEGGVSDYLLDYATHTFKHLKGNMFHHDQMGLYYIIRKGTYATPGARPYMPHYPMEKMSDFQIESLRAFIEQEASK